MNDKKISSRPGKGAVEAVNVGGISVTHPKKVWWPEEKITKLDVVQYYAAIAPYILPWLKNHPLTAERCPDGMKGQCFFQKNFIEALPPGVPTRAISAQSTEETEVPQVAEETEVLGQAHGRF